MPITTKKILISGMTGANVRGQLTRTQVYTQSHMYREGLKYLKYDVYNAPPDENDITGQVLDHDYFLIGLAPIGSITAGWRMPCLALIGKILLEGKKLITFVDDWQFQSIYPSISNIQEVEKAKATFLRDISMGRIRDETFFDMWKDEIMLGIGLILSRNHTMLSSIMDFGHSNDPYYELSENPIFLDPSSYQPIPEISAGIRFKQWVIAGLADYTKYVTSLNCSWPVVHVGGKIENKFKSEKESVVFDAYSKSKGILIPTYKSSNTNWWRPRYLFARQFANVIYSAPGTTGSYDCFNVPIEKIERESHSGLQSLIDLQKQVLDEIVWSAPKFLNKLGETFGRNI